MTAKNKIRIIFLFFLLGLAVSCTVQGDSADELPGITIPIEEMNTAFVIVDEPVLANSHNNGEDIALVLRNISDKSIVFPNDFSLSIFRFQDQAWNSVQNNFNYSDDEKILLTSEEFPPGLMAIAYPDIPELSEPTIIRIVMIGHYENAEDDIVGAYLDITLLP